MEEKQFAILTKESVRLMAEAAGHTNLPEDVALLLGEDVSYRLREITMASELKACSSFAVTYHR